MRPEETMTTSTDSRAPLVVTIRTHFALLQLLLSALPVCPTEQLIRSPLTLKFLHKYTINSFRLQAF